MLTRFDLLRGLAVVSFAAGAGLLIVALALGGGKGRGSEASRAELSPTPGRDLVATPTNTATPAPTNAPTATPTPVPFDGKVARLKLPRFAVDSPIEELGLKDTNELDTPADPLKTGWYRIYDKPGFGGNAVFSAHVDYYPNIIGPFNQLAKAQLGDEVVVVMENGLEYRYRVISNRRYDVNSIPMGEIIWPSNRPAGNEWVTLITCGGEFRASRPGGPGEYLHRDVVVAERVS